MRRYEKQRREKCVTSDANFLLYNQVLNSPSLRRLSARRPLNTPASQHRSCRGRSICEGLRAALKPVQVVEKEVSPRGAARSLPWNTVNSLPRTAARPSSPVNNTSLKLSQIDALQPLKHSACGGWKEKEKGAENRNFHDCPATFLLSV